MNYQNGVSINEVQAVELEILNEFDRICKMHSIPYQLFAGTLLGAIRHNGFIPWDDDIDVCLLRKDYERFLHVSKNDLNDSYFLQTCFSDPTSIVQFAKIRKKGTVFRNLSDLDNTYETGIYIDVFPLDNVYPEMLLGKFQPWLFAFWYLCTTSSVKKRVERSKNIIVKLVRKMFYQLLKVYPKQKCDLHAQRVLRMFESKETEYINHLTNGVTKTRLRKYLRKRETFYNIIEWEFEGTMFPIPSNYHDVLTRNFGDYMQFPPEEQRYPQHGVIEVKI